MMIEAAMNVDSAMRAGGDPLDLVRGAIGGAFVIGVAYLAGIAVIRRSFEAFGALLVVGAAGVMEFFALGLLTALSPAKIVFVQSIFAASVMVFLSAAIEAARRNPILGGLIFTTALITLGMGAGHGFGFLELGAMMRYGFMGVAGFAGVLILVQAFRGDRGAQLLLPGAAVALAAPWLAGFFAVEAAAIAPHALFSFGILAASLIALPYLGAEAGALTRPLGDKEGLGGAGIGGGAFANGAQADDAGSVFSTQAEPQAPSARETAALDEAAASEPTYVSDNQLAEVLDYAGISVMDWSEEGAHHSAGFAELFAGAAQPLSPEAMLESAHQKDHTRLEQELYGAGKGDGAFDVSFTKQDGAKIRLRGARAVDEGGRLERLVVFAEPLIEQAQPSLLDGKWAAGAAGAVMGAGVAAGAKMAGDGASKASDERASSSTTNLSSNPALKSVPQQSGLTTTGAEKTSAHKATGPGAGLQAPSAKKSAFAAAAASAPRMFTPAQESAADQSDPSKQSLGIAAAISQGQLRAAFQPIVSLEGEEVRGFEALLRAQDAEKDFNGMSTEEIVAKAEEEGQGDALAEMMMDASAAFLAQKLKTGDHDGLFVAFNVSYGQLRAKGFVEKTAQAIKDYDLPPRALVLELTESEAVTDDEAARETFTGLKNIGAALAFDDFGAGFSSLSNLRKFEFDYLKVDKSFVEKVVDDNQASKIITALSGLGGDLGMTVIAEGVSSEEIAKAVQKCGCRFAQGYYYGKPEVPPQTEMQPAAQQDASKQATSQQNMSLSDAPETSAPRNDGMPGFVGPAGTRPASNLTVQGRVKAHNLR